MRANTFVGATSGRLGCRMLLGAEWGKLGLRARRQKQVLQEKGRREGRKKERKNDVVVVVSCHGRSVCLP